MSAESRDDQEREALRQIAKWPRHIYESTAVEDMRQVARAALVAREEPHLTHGRHCPCSACAREDWTNPNLAPCGMHGPTCAAVYAPIPRAREEKHGP
jgi:hypothetical protein